MALGEVYIPVLCFSPVSNISAMLHTQLLTQLLAYLLNYLLTYLLHGAESNLRKTRFSASPEIPAFYRTRRFITAFISALYPISSSTTFIRRTSGRSLGAFKAMLFRILGSKGRIWSQCPRGLRRRSAAARPLRLWVRIPPEAWMTVSCECCVLSGRGLCDELITRPEESYRMWCVVECDLGTSWMRRPWPNGESLSLSKNLEFLDNSNEWVPRTKTRKNV